jgi:hypothetical protein
MKREAKGKAPYQALGLEETPQQEMPDAHEVEFIPTPTTAEEISPSVR